MRCTFPITTQTFCCHVHWELTTLVLGYARNFHGQHAVCHADPMGVLSTSGNAVGAGYVWMYNYATFAQWHSH